MHDSINEFKTVSNGEHTHPATSNEKHFKQHIMKRIASRNNAYFKSIRQGHAYIHNITRTQYNGIYIYT